jgi:hypothetical protein
MTTFLKQTIHYDQVASIIAKSINNWDAGQILNVDETKLTAEEFALLKKYLEQENYLQQ